MADVTCEKCDEYYKDPRMLPCLHTYCLCCLEKELESQTVLHCPNCKEEVTLSKKTEYLIFLKICTRQIKPRLHVSVKRLKIQMNIAKLVGVVILVEEQLPFALNVRNFFARLVQNVMENDPYQLNTL